MGDLFGGLIKSDLGHNSFWGKYEHLNSYNTINDSILFRYQIAKLRALEKSNHKKYSNIDTFVKESKKIMGSLDSDIEEASVSKIYSRLIELINSALWSSELNPTRTSLKSDNWRRDKEQKINDILNEIKVLLEQIHVNTPLAESIVAQLSQRLDRMGDTKEYVAIKADWAEQLAEDIFNQISGFRAIQSGAFVDAFGQQLIEDVFAFDENTLSLPFNAELNYEIKVDGVFQKRTVKSVGDFLSQINSLNTSGTIKLSNPLYEALQKASILNAQVKSGINQPILTTAERNSISLNQTGFTPMSLWELYTLQSPPDKVWFKKDQNSKTLSSLANYALSRAITSTALSRNQLYFTEKGIVTASQWMEISKYMLKFKPDVNSIGPDFLSLSRQYRLSKI